MVLHVFLLWVPPPWALNRTDLWRSGATRTFLCLRHNRGERAAAFPASVALPPSQQLSGALQLPWASCQTVLLCWCFCYVLYVYIYISSQPMLPLRGTWMSNVDTRADGKEGGRTGPHRPATPPLPRILSANGSAGIWEWGWRWTETDGSWQTRTDSQWIQGSVAERSEQERIKERLTFKVLPCLVPPHRQLRGKCLRLVSWSFCQAAVVRLSGQPSSSHTNFDTQQICTQPLLSRTRDMPAVSQNN